METGAPWEGRPAAGTVFIPCSIMKEYLKKRSWFEKFKTKLEREL